MARKYRLREYPNTDVFPFNIGPALVQGEFHEHGHDFIELTVIFAGSAVQVINGVSHACRAGDMYVFHRGTVHAFKEARKLSMMNAMFTPELLRGIGRDVRRLSGYQALFVLGSRTAQEFRCTLHLDAIALHRVRSLLEAMEQEFTARHGGYQTAIGGYMAQLVVDVSRLYGTARTTAPDSAAGTLAMAEVAANIEQNLGAPHSIDTLSAAAHLSRRHFIRQFVKAYGVTPIRYVLDKRLEQATERLKDGRLRITDVGFACGFEDSNYFTRQFTRKYGMPPRQFRQLSSLLD